MSCSSKSGGVLCFCYNQCIVGTSAQQNFIQRIAAKITGMSYPLIYLLGMLFPCHFYAQAKQDPGAILGVPPLCCYTNKQNSFGFASNLDQSRVYLTNGGSSTSTDVHLTYFNYDVQCNAAMSNIDSRLVSRHGFVVDEMSPTGISLRDNTQTELSEAVDSHQAALDLAGTQPYLDFDLFLTFTPNQALHPGLSHLHEWKTWQLWLDHFPNYHCTVDVE